MKIPIKVSGQKMRLPSNYKFIAPKSQKFVNFVFDLSSDWDGLTIFAQFGQNGEGYNQYLDENNRAKTAHGNSKMGGIFKGVSAKDLRLMADAIVKNKGSENQYDYGITEEGVLYSVQNQAQRVTKGYDASTITLQSLWDDIGYNTGADHGTYGQDADLNLW